MRGNSESLAGMWLLKVREQKASPVLGGLGTVYMLIAMTRDLDDNDPSSDEKSGVDMRISVDSGSHHRLDNRQHCIQP